MRLILCGGAACVWEDIKPFFYEENSETHWGALNDIGMFLPVRLRFWYSNDAERLKSWAKLRRENLNQDFKCHSRANWDVPGHGTSALNACYVALRLGYDEVILCGVPLDDSPYFFEPEYIGRKSNANFVREVPHKDGRMKWWEQARDAVFEGRVRSMSGRTKELLG